MFWGRASALRTPVKCSGVPCLFPSLSLSSQDHRLYGLRGTIKGCKFQGPGRMMGKPGNRAEVQWKFLGLHSEDEGLVGYSGLKAIDFRPLMASSLMMRK